MTRLFTEIDIPRPGFEISLSSKTVVLGSCFSDGVGSKMKAAGMDVLVNPFGTLYNPLSIASAIGRLESGRPFTGEECVLMGAGAGKICSFSHHTRFARNSADEFLENANGSLACASAFWKACDTVVITLGTVWVWRLAENGAVVSNCLKRNPSEFTHSMLSVGEVAAALSGITSAFPSKRFVFTVSPIRHLWNGAHSNQLSKSTLLLGCESVCREPLRFYFPSYEIILDELRDYRFYAEDLCHPSGTAVGIVWERFLDTFVPSSEIPAVRENERAARRAAHRDML